MDNNHLISIVVIFLNSAKFIDEAIASVFAQTWDSWELLLVDDGSTDASVEISRKYAERFPGRISYLEHPGHQNRGMSASRNLGVKHAKGDLIAFLDSDDVWLPEKLETQVALMDAHPAAAMVYGSSQYWYSWTGETADLGRDFVPAVGVETERVYMPPALLTLSLKSICRTPCPSDFLVRHDVVKEVGGFDEQFRGDLSLFEDQAFLAKVFLKRPVYVTQLCLDRYRRHPDSCVSVAAQRGTKHYTGLRYFRRLQDYLRAQEVTDAELWKALRNKRFRYRQAAVYHALARARTHVSRLKSGVLDIAKRSLLHSFRRQFR